VLAVPLALLGLGLIVGFDWSDLPGDYRLGVIFGLLTATAYAGYLLKPVNSPAVGIPPALFIYCCDPKTTYHSLKKTPQASA
jgi:hypothetical protein